MPDSDLQELGTLATEQRNPSTANLDQASSLEIIRLMNEEDSTVAGAVRAALPLIAQLVDRIVERLSAGGRLFYVGAGTSGRLGMLDAAECPPTFGVSPAMVQCLVAGGVHALTHSVEGAEDSESAGAAAVAAAGLNHQDVLTGIAASGRTPFVIGAIRAARELGAFTAALANTPGSVIGRFAHLAIDMPVGPEVLTGSTRLKSGACQKMVLNMLTTATMVRLGKSYGNLMVDVQVTNAKLQDRAQRIVMAAAALDAAAAEAALAQAGGSAKLAILIAKTGLGPSEARQALAEVGGRLREAIVRQNGDRL